MEKIVIALGGNALQEGKGSASAEAQLKVIEKTSEYIADIIEAGYSVALAHGNGPQVGRIVIQNEYAAPVTPAMPFDVCGAMSQGMIGYHIQQALRRALEGRGISKDVLSVVTQVVVNADDPAFDNPEKPIGPFYSQEEACRLQVDKGYVMKEDSGRGWRRVVASPNPARIVELAGVKALMDNGFVVVTVGGGGIPVIEEKDGTLKGAAAVIDKDLACERLGEDIGADILLILTAVEKVYIRYGTPDAKALDSLTTAEALKYMEEGHFAPGSMKPKIEAAVRFARSRPGRRAIITSLDKATDALKGLAGTAVTQ